MKYTDEYKHFDNLIWQLPAWNTAIFILAITGVAVIADSKITNLAPEVSNKDLAFGFIFVCWFFQMAIFNALVRFRHHQSRAIGDDNTFLIKWWCKGQFWLQNAIIIQAGALSFLALSIFWSCYALVISIVLMLLMLVYSSMSVRSQPRTKG